MLPVRRLPTHPTGRSLIRYFAITVAAITVAVLATSALADKAPPTSQHLTAQAAAFRVKVYAKEPCLAHIIDVEDPSWDPTISYHGGHNINDSYGLGQGDPGTKTARYTYTVGRHRAGDPVGPGWSTGLVPELAWMRNYSIGRYGSECDAWDFRRWHGSY